MARPAALQFLQKGKLLAGAVFPRFVATWNWLVGAFDSMIGDADLNPQQGYINVDRTNPDRPIIRFNAFKLNGLGGGSVEARTPGRFEIVQATDSSGVAIEGAFNFLNAFYNVGGKTYLLNSASVSGAASKIIALKITATGSSPSATIEKYSDFQALSSAQQDLSYYVIPLYTTNASKVTVDWRIGPDTVMGEF